RVWFLKETKSICTSCATGCNTIIGTREDVIYRQTPRENDHVNSCWMCDYGRLNFYYLQSDQRLLEPQIRSEGKLVPTDWPSAIADAVKSGQVKALVILKENTMHLGIPVEQLAQLPAFIMVNILSNEATEKATVVLPACGFAEKRGSMINGRGRLQRLNRGVRPPGNARDDWEILRDLLQAVGGGDSLLSIDDVYRRISETVLQFAVLTLSKIGDLGVHILQ